MDEILSLLIAIIFWPYNAWKDSIENSRLGSSEDEQKTLNLWKWIAIIATAILLIIYLKFF